MFMQIPLTIRLPPPPITPFGCGFAFVFKRQFSMKPCSYHEKYPWRIKKLLIYDTKYSIIQNMDTATKLLKAMQANPRDWRIDQMQTVARRHGIDWRHDGTSHCVFTWPDGRTLSVPARRPVKPFYVRQFVKMLETEV
jgi:hypothetical protein